MLCSAVCCRPTVCSSRVKGLSSVIEWFDGLKANEFVDVTASLYRYMFVCMSVCVCLSVCVALSLYVSICVCICAVVSVAFVLYNII